jgi:hypothetical protein
LRVIAGREVDGKVASINVYTHWDSLQTERSAALQVSSQLRPDASSAALQYFPLTLEDVSEMSLASATMNLCKHKGESGDAWQHVTA